jgi:AcrR family transcriptional regulator
MAVADKSPGAPRRGRPATGVREAILSATESILTDAGVARLSTKEVARRAGVAESSIYYHFGDRLGLLLAVVQTHLPPVKQVLEELYRTVGAGELRDDLIALLDALERFFLRALPIAAAIESDSELRKAFAERSGQLDVGPHRALDGVRGYLAEQRGRGRLPRSLDVDATALLLVGAAHQRALQRRISATGTYLASTAQLVDVLLPALTPLHPTTA